MTILFRRKQGGARVQHPLEPVQRTAVLAAGFAAERNVRVFPEGWSRGAERFRPAVIAGTLDRLLDAAAQGAKVSHALVVYTSDPGCRLTRQDRDRLWDAFGVPLFEQVLGASGEVVAAECEAHAGLHVVGEPGNLELDHGLCACGSEGPRLMVRKAMAKAAMA